MNWAYWIIDNGFYFLGLIKLLEVGLNKAFFWPTDKNKAYVMAYIEARVKEEEEEEWHRRKAGSKKSDAKVMH